jgi:hypothetical protein
MISPTSSKTVRLGLAALFLALGARLAADPLDYPGFVSGTVADVGAPLAQYLSQTGQASLSIAAAGIRELTTGERSPLCEHLENDLNRRLRSDTPYGVPSATELQEAWLSIGGNASDMGNQASTLRKYGRGLSVDVVLTGYYTTQADAVSITVRLLRCTDGTELWAQNRTITAASLVHSDLSLYNESAPPGYGLEAQAPEVTAPPPSAFGVTQAASAAPLSGTPEIALRPAPRSSLPAGVKLERNIHETEFSIYRLCAEAGYENLYPLNSSFRKAVHDVGGAYAEVNWADIFHVGLDTWYRASLPGFNDPNDGLYPVQNLLGFGLSLGLTAPYRMGHYFVFYGGLGGRFESITLNSPVIPSVDAVSFGNNAFCAIAGVKAHKGDVGLDLNADYDMAASWTGYWRARLGAYYEYTFE